MSGSPKYSAATLAEQQQRRIEAERRRRAEEESRKRLEAEASYRKTEFERHIRMAEEGVRSTLMKLDHAMRDNEPFFNALQLQSLRGALSEISSRASACGENESEVARLVMDSAEVQKRFNRMEVDARNGRRAHEQVLRIEAERIREAEKRRLREEERRRKEEEAEQRRKERLDENWKAALTLIRNCTIGFEQDMAGLNAFVDMTRMTACSNSIDRLAETLMTERPDEAVLGQVRTKVKDFEKEVAVLRAEAQENKLIHDLDAVRNTAKLLRDDLSAIEYSIKLDSAGRSQIENQLDTASMFISKRDLNKARAAIEEARENLEGHKDRVVKRVERIAAQKAAADGAIVRARAILAGLAADPVITRWVKSEVDRVAAAISRVECEMVESNFTQVPEKCIDAIAIVEQIDKKAQEMQIAEDKRQYILGAICEVMRSKGYVIQSGYPALENAGDLASDMIVLAQRPGGGQLAVGVPTTGNIQFDIPDWEKTVQDTGSGQIIRRCDQPEAQIKEVNALLDGFGIKMSPLTWEGKIPDEILKEAKVLPRSHENQSEI